MNKHLPRIVSLLLVPCLIVDPVSASVSAVFEPISHVSKVNRHASLFESEALISAALLYFRTFQKEKTSEFDRAAAAKKPSSKPIRPERYSPQKVIRFKPVTLPLWAKFFLHIREMPRVIGDDSGPGGAPNVSSPIEYLVNRKGLTFDQVLRRHALNRRPVPANENPLTWPIFEGEEEYLKDLEINAPSRAALGQALREAVLGGSIQMTDGFKKVTGTPVLPEDNEVLLMDFLDALSDETHGPELINHYFITAYAIAQVAVTSTNPIFRTHSLQTVALLRTIARRWMPPTAPPASGDFRPAGNPESEVNSLKRDSELLPAARNLSERIEKLPAKAKTQIAFRAASDFSWMFKTRYAYQLIRLRWAVFRYALFHQPASVAAMDDAIEKLKVLMKTALDQVALGRLDENKVPEQATIRFKGYLRSDFDADQWRTISDSDQAVANLFFPGNDPESRDRQKEFLRSSQTLTRPLVLESLKTLLVDGINLIWIDHWPGFRVAWHLAGDFEIVGLKRIVSGELITEPDGVPIMLLLNAGYRDAELASINAHEKTHMAINAMFPEFNNGSVWNSSGITDWVTTGIDALVEHHHSRFESIQSDKEFEEGMEALDRPLSRSERFRYSRPNAAIYSVRQRGSSWVISRTDVYETGAYLGGLAYAAARREAEVLGKSDDAEWIFQNAGRRFIRRLQEGPPYTLLSFLESLPRPLDTDLYIKASLPDAPKRVDEKLSVPSDSKIVYREAHLGQELADAGLVTGGGNDSKFLQPTPALIRARQSFRKLPDNIYTVKANGKIFGLTFDTLGGTEYIRAICTDESAEFYDFGVFHEATPVPRKPWTTQNAMRLIHIARRVGLKTNSAAAQNFGPRQHPVGQQIYRAWFAIAAQVRDARKAGKEVIPPVWTELEKVPDIKLALDLAPTSRLADPVIISQWPARPEKMQLTGDQNLDLSSHLARLPDPQVTELLISLARQNAATFRVVSEEVLHLLFDPDTRVSESAWTIISTLLVDEPWVVAHNPGEEVLASAWIARKLGARIAAFARGPEANPRNLQLGLDRASQLMYHFPPKRLAAELTGEFVWLKQLLGEVIGHEKPFQFINNLLAQAAERWSESMGGYGITREEQKEAGRQRMSQSGEAKSIPKKDESTLQREEAQMRDPELFSEERPTKPAVQPVPRPHSPRWELPGIFNFQDSTEKPNSEPIAAPMQAEEVLAYLASKGVSMRQVSSAVLRLRDLSPGQRSLHIASGNSWLPVAEALMGLHVQAFDTNDQRVSQMNLQLEQLGIREEINRRKGSFEYTEVQQPTQYTDLKGPYSHIVAIDYVDLDPNAEEKLILVIANLIDANGTILFSAGSMQNDAAIKNFQKTHLRFEFRQVNDEFRTSPAPHPFESLWLLNVRPGRSVRSFEGASSAAAAPNQLFPAVEIIHPEKLAKFQPRLFLWDFDNTIWNGFPHEKEEYIWAQWAFRTGTPDADQLALTRQFFKTAQGLNRDATIRKWRHDGYPDPGNFEVFLPHLEDAIDQIVRESDRGTSAYLLPGVKNMLQAMQSAGVVQKIVTGGPRDKRWSYAKRLQISHFFSGIHGGEPKPEVVQEYVHEWGAEHVAMVGDGVADMEAPLKAGALAIGYAETPEKRAMLIAAGADVIINKDFLALPEILHALFRDPDSRENSPVTAPEAKEPAAARTPSSVARSRSLGNPKQRERVRKRSVGSPPLELDGGNIEDEEDASWALKEVIQRNSDGRKPSRSVRLDADTEDHIIDLFQQLPDRDSVQILANLARDSSAALAFIVRCAALSLARNGFQKAARRLIALLGEMNPTADALLARELTRWVVGPSAAYTKEDIVLYRRLYALDPMHSRSARELGEDILEDIRIHALMDTLSAFGTEAGVYLQSHRAEAAAETKSNNTLVTNVDYAIQRRLFELILTNPRFADVYIDAEENLEQAGVSPELIRINAANFGKTSLIISADPLDGTNIYAKKGSSDYSFALTLLLNGNPVYVLIVAPEANQRFEGDAKHGIRLNGVTVTPDWAPLSSPARIIGKGSYSQGILHPLKDVLPRHFSVTEKADSLILQVARMSLRIPGVSYDAISSATNPAHDSLPSAALIHLTGGKAAHPDGTPFFPTRWSSIDGDARLCVPFIAGSPVVVDELVDLHRTMAVAAQWTGPKLQPITAGATPSAESSLRAESSLPLEAALDRLRQILRLPGIQFVHIHIPSLIDDIWQIDALTPEAVVIWTDRLVETIQETVLKNGLRYSIFDVGVRKSVVTEFMDPIRKIVNYAYFHLHGQAYEGPGSSAHSILEELNPHLTDDPALGSQQAILRRAA